MSAMNNTRNTGLNLLSLDAGGPQGISQLQILVNVMESVSQDCNGNPEERIKRPCDVFSLVGGVGTGGLIAIFLVALKMTAKQALEEFTSFVIETFGEVDPKPVKQTEKLTVSIETILRNYNVNKDDKLITPGGPEQPCKLVVPVMYKNHVGVPCVLRNYIARHEPLTDLTIAEAMLATCATPPMFTPTSISKDFATFEYVGGGLGLSNPTREIIAEAHHAFGNEATIACLLSIGCGHPGVNIVPSDPTTTWTGFLERLAMDSEKTARDVATHLAQLSLYYRLSVRYGLEGHHSRVLGDPQAITTRTITYLQDLETIEIVGRCMDAIRTGDGFTTLEQLRHAGGSKVLPPPRPPLTPNYVERKVAMEFMEKAIFNEYGGIKAGSKRIMVTGIGGCGKTQLVRKFVELYGDRFISTFLVDGSSRETLRRDFVRHVRSLGSAHSQDSFDDSMTFLSQSVCDGQRLLIVDNVDDLTLDLSPFLPRWTDGVVIVTSRNVSRGQLSPQTHLQLDVMSLDESVELLVRGSGRTWPPSEPEKEAAMAVAMELGCHPIALVQAISYMSNTGYTAETYISRLRGHRKQLLGDPATNQLDMRYLTAFAAFDASYDILPSNAQKTLHLLSYFHRQKFPLDLISLAAEDDFSKDEGRYLPRGAEFEDGKGYLKETFYPSDEWSPCEMDSIITSLRNQSLIAVVPAPDVTLLEMHSLVHEWSRFRIPGGILKQVQAAVVRLLCCGAKKDNFRMMQYLFHHVEALSSVWNNLHANDAASFGFILGESGMYANAAKLGERVHELLKTKLGMDHHSTIMASVNLAVTYMRLGRYADAEVLQVEVLRRLKQLLGTDHPDTVMVSANLAVTYTQLGRYTDAEVLQVEVLGQLKQLLGTDHPNTIMTSENLAITYIRLGRYADAEVLQVEVLRRRKQLLGTDNPGTIDASANLAITYRELGRYADAEVMEVEVLRRRKQLLGMDHPDTVMASANLAVSYKELGRDADAEVLEVEVLRKRKQLLGTDHPGTIMASANLAVTYMRLGRYADAEVLQVEVLRRRKQLLGTDHPNTIMASANLAVTYTQLGRYTDAEVLQVEVLRRRKQLLGTDNPGTIDASANLATTYQQLGRYADAEVLQVEVLRRRKQLLGIDHPDTVMASANLAITYRELGRYADAEVMEVEVLRRRKQLLGMDHPDTVMASANLAVSYKFLGRDADAEVLEVEVLRKRKQLLGTDHPDTIRSSVHLAITYGLLGRYADAKVLSEEAVGLCKSVLGLKHPETLKAVELVAFLDKQCDRPENAVSQATSDPLPSTIDEPVP